MVENAILTIFKGDRKQIQLGSFGFCKKCNGFAVLDGERFYYCKRCDKQYYPEQVLVTPRIDTEEK